MLPGMQNFHGLSVPLSAAAMPAGSLVAEGISPPIWDASAETARQPTCRLGIAVKTNVCCAMREVLAAIWEGAPG